mmetsp:Transcript_21030/g.32561  ORF Transcript_21030/g.32561 Transcript_21030/m.32561 type:complete len:119 (-) Transcript_21030:279-635(-)
MRNLYMYYKRLKTYIDKREKLQKVQEKDNANKQSSQQPASGFMQQISEQQPQSQPQTRSQTTPSGGTSVASPGGSLGGGMISGGSDNERSGNMSSNPMASGGTVQVVLTPNERESLII